MPVLDTPVHPLVKRDKDAPYGCKDREMSKGYWVKERWYYEDGRYALRDLFIPHRMSTECRYDKSTTDPRCATCKHRGVGEEYAKKLLAAA